VSEFVEECRREWRRLGVPDPVANEMAADLTADLEEAAAEGGSPEDVLGNSAFDPRRFAAAWAIARGVTGPPLAERPSRWRSPVAIAVAALLGLLTLCAGLVLVVGYHSHSFAFAVRRVVAGPGSLRIFPPVAGRFTSPRQLVGSGIVGVDVHPLAFLLLVVGVVGLGLLAVLYRSLWWDRRRFRRPGSPPPHWD